MAPITEFLHHHLKYSHMIMPLSYKSLSVPVPLISCFAAIFLICLSSEAAKNPAGITIDLIHPDSPLSPLYNPTETRFDRARKAYTQSFARHSHLNSLLSRRKSTEAFHAPLEQGGGAYLMRVGIGTPAFKVWAIVDTGSDLAWTQCKPCQRCYRQDAPLFYPRKSSTYKNIPCSSQKCRASGSGSSCGRSGCAYRESYGDRSYSAGSLATETFSFDTTRFPNVTFGCGFNNGGAFNPKTSGIIGLGGRPLSIVKQLDKAVGGRFAYCLASRSGNTTSKISFGENAVVSGPNTVSTPMVKKSPSTFYYLTLEGISVGKEKLSLKSDNPEQARGGKGNILIDSGTTLTFLPSDLYDEFISTLEKAVDGKRIQGPQRFDLCYRSSSQINVPPVTAHFTGADLVLPQESIFVEVAHGVVCSTFSGSKLAGGSAIFGNLHQINYLVGYDLGAGKVSFQKTDCSKYK